MLETARILEENASKVIRDNLIRKYGKLVNMSVINVALRLKDIKPDIFIDDYIDRLEHLESKYGRLVSVGVIKIAALNHRNNPDHFVDWFIDVENYFKSGGTAVTGLIHTIMFRNAFKPKEEIVKLVAEELRQRAIKKK